MICCASSESVRSNAWAKLLPAAELVSVEFVKEKHEVAPGQLASSLLANCSAVGQRPVHQLPGDRIIEPPEELVDGELQWSQIPVS